MKLSVIIPCYNAADTIASQLEALSKQQWSEPWEVILSDNGSNDNTLSVVDQFKELLPNLRVVDSSDRRGPAHARNVGALSATANSFVFCDADDEVAPGWLSAIGEALSKYDFVASHFEFKKLNPSWTNDSSSMPQQEGIGRLWYPPYLPHAGGSGIGIKRSLHEAVGGFDETLPRMMDTDYCLKVQLKGIELHFVPNAILHVRLRKKLGGMFNQTRLWGQYNILMYKRYRPSKGKLIRPWISYVRAWMDIIYRLPQIRHKKDLSLLVRAVGYCIGQFQGSVRYRVPPV